MLRSTAVVRRELAEGLTGLKAIASSAFLFGILANLHGIFYSFGAVGGERSARMAALAEALSLSLNPTAISLVVAILAYSLERFLSGRLEDLHLEMQCASSELLTQIARLPKFVDRPLPERPLPLAYEPPSRWPSYVSLMLIFAAWLTEGFHFNDTNVYDEWDIKGVTFAAAIHVALTFGISCIPAQFIWTKLLSNRHTSFLWLAAIFCFAWCLAEEYSGIRAF